MSDSIRIIRSELWSPWIFTVFLFASFSYHRFWVSSKGRKAKILIIALIILLFLALTIIRSRDQEDDISESYKPFEGKFSMAKELIGQGNAKEGCRVMEEALKLHQGDPGELAAELGDCLISAGEYGKAEEAYISFLAGNPSSPSYARVMSALGHAMLLGGKREEAARAFEKALSMDPMAEGAVEGLIQAEIPGK